MDSVPERRRRRDVGHSSITAQWGIVGDDDLAQSDYEDTNVLGTNSDQEISLTPKKKLGKRKRSNSGNKKAKRNRVKR